ncbi:hypothetical protein GCM10009799_14440 [Nocardiopsis rhodophaea]|uniref:DUF2637 domain-containing protein n=1 Tax=Nocardiopsis rhodophaea TaxID=280238 RepID=A0ABN2SQF6_9ACTN
MQRAARTLDYALTTVAVGALAFSTVNVALLAIDHGIPAWIAWLLEPLVGIALWAVLSSDAVLSRYDTAPSLSARLPRTFTGMVTLTLNIWSSLFTTPHDGQLQFAPDPTGVLLHAIAPILLILLAEAAPQYRARFTRLIERLQPSDEPPSTTARSPQVHASPPCPDPEQGAGPDPGETSASSPDTFADDSGSTRSPDAQPFSTETPALRPGRQKAKERTTGRRMTRKQRRLHKRQLNDDRARTILRAEPDITGAELARRLGVQPRSGQRILHRITKTNSPTSQR